MKKLFFISIILLHFNLSFSQDLIWSKSYTNINKKINNISFNLYEIGADSLLLTTQKSFQGEWFLQYKIDDVYLSSDTIKFKNPNKNIQIYIYRNKSLTRKYFLEIKKSIFHEKKTS